MQSLKLLGTELTWCARCSHRFSKLNSRFGLTPVERQTVLAFYVLQRQNSTDVIPPPVFEGETKKYAPKIQKLVDEISQLTLIEVADLNELLKKTLKITDVPAMAFSAAAPAAKSPALQEEEDSAEPAKQEKTLFTVKMVKFDEAKKVAIIKEVKSIVAGMNLVQAKKFVESLPQTLKVDVSKEESEKLKAAMEAVGAVVEIE